MSDYGDLVVAALHADAEAARAEIRAAGIICPSCDTNMADLPDGHALVITGDTPGPWTAECGSGQPVSLASVPATSEAFAKWQAVGNITVYDDFRRREAEAFKRIVGEGPAQFTGLLSVLDGEGGSKEG